MSPLKKELDMKVKFGSSYIQRGHASKRVTIPGNFTSFMRCLYNCLSVQICLIFSSPEPKAHGELIVYQSSRRPSVRLCVRPSTLSNMNISAFMRSIIEVGVRLHQVFGQIGLEHWFPWQRIAPIGL